MPVRTQDRGSYFIFNAGGVIGVFTSKESPSVYLGEAKFGVLIQRVIYFCKLIFTG